MPADKLGRYMTSRTFLERANAADKRQAGEPQDVLDQRGVNRTDRTGIDRGKYRGALGQAELGDHGKNQYGRHEQEISPALGWTEEPGNHHDVGETDNRRRYSQRQGERPAGELAMLGKCPPE